MRSIVEIYRNGLWIAAGEFEPVGKGPYTATFEYRLDYVFGDDPAPVSLALPVTAERIGFDGDGNAPPCPPFLLDLVPQGRGRKYLAHELGIADDGDARDLFLSQFGAFNPIGNLRLDTAVKFYRERTEENEQQTSGFRLEDILRKKDAFLDHIGLHAMLSAGTTGVQGAAPKFLLTQDAEGLWHADAALPDDRAARHWLVKLPRGAHETDYRVLRNEAAYLRVAERCGIRTEGEPQLHGDMLFVRRFDRCADSRGLRRLHQESLAALAGHRGFGLPAPLFDLVRALRDHVTDPIGETVEFIRRDILNQAMRNTDNHARNTAVQCLPDGRIQLTPLFDFAPMYMDREMVLRGCRWRHGKEGAELAEWTEVIEALPFDDHDRQVIAGKVLEFAPVVGCLAETMKDCGVDATIIEDCKPSIDAQARRLARLPALIEESSHGPTP